MVVANDSVVDIEMPTFEASSACEQSLKCYTCSALPACALLHAALQSSVHLCIIKCCSLSLSSCHSLATPGKFCHVA